MNAPWSTVGCRNCGADPGQRCYDRRAWVLDPHNPVYLSFPHAERVADADFVQALGTPTTERASIAAQQILNTGDV